MSFYWYPHCVSCDETGPKIRSGMTDTLKFGDEHTESTALFKAWLDQHEHHEVTLLSIQQLAKRTSSVG